MTEKDFARQISSYIDLNTIKNVLLSFDNNKQIVLKKSVSFLGSSCLENAEKWDLYALITDYLKNFQVAEESIDLLVKIEGDEKFSIEAIEWLKNYRFSGELRGKPNINIDTSILPFEPIVAIIAESGIIDILHIPLNFLFNSVEVFSETWREMELIGAHVFLEPSSLSELFIYIEKRVAKHYKNLESNNAGTLSGASVFNGYRYVCATSDIPIDNRLLNISREGAIYQAKSTLN